MLDTIISAVLPELKLMASTSDEVGYFHDRGWKNWGVCDVVLIEFDQDKIIGYSHSGILTKFFDLKDPEFKDKIREFYGY